MRVLFATIAVLAGVQADESSLAKTRTVDFRDGETVAVRVRMSAANQNILSAVTFPDLVQNVVSSWSDRDLSIEYQGAKLFLKLFAKTEGHLDVVTAGGTHVRLYIRPTAAILGRGRILAAHRGGDPLPLGRFGCPDQAPVGPWGPPGDITARIGRA